MCYGCKHCHFNYKFTFLYNSICDVSDTYENISDGKFYLLFYSLLSVGSVWLYNIDSVWTFETITIFPLVYLYIVLMISFYPLLKFSNKKMSNIKMPDDMVMSMISVVVIICLFMFLFPNDTFKLFSVESF